MAAPGATNVEAAFLELVRRGVFKVDSIGRVWRVGLCGCSPHFFRVRPIAPRRAEVPDRKDEYLCVKFILNGKGRTAQAHRLVWAVRRGPIPLGLTVNHKNGRKRDNRPGNLELATHSEQQIHRRHVLKVRGPYGTDFTRSKLNEEKVLEIRKRAAAGETQGALAKEFGVHQSNISCAIRRKTWAHV
jgi:hypothetical protein